MFECFKHQIQKFRFQVFQLDQHVVQVLLVQVFLKLLVLLLLNRRNKSIAGFKRVKLLPHVLTEQRDKVNQLLNHDILSKRISSSLYNRVSTYIEYLSTYIVILAA